MSMHHHHHEHGPDCVCGEHHHEHSADCDCGAHHHEHGPDCGCGAHHHEHGPDCDCGCHEHDAGSVIEGALIISRRGVLRFNPPVEAGSALRELVLKIQEICALIAVEGDILGHVKALIRCQAGRLALSITRVDYPSVTVLESWRGDQAVSECEMSLNILSVANTEARGDVEALLSRLFE